MSIIERAAELLRSAPRTQQEASTGSQGAGDSAPDLVARAAQEIGRRAASPETRTTRPAGRTARTLRVDRARLQQQSMILPDGGRSAIGETFRQIKRTIFANAASPKAGAPPANLVMVTSASPGEGKTYCAVNLAISIALEVDRRVLLVDADVAKPGVAQVLGVETGKGLMDALIDHRIDLAEVLLKTDIGKLTLMSVGTQQKNATELLASDAMRDLLREVAERYSDRIVVFDSPPLLAASEAGVLASQMGQIVVVVEAGKTSEAALKDALGRLDASRIVGLLLNKGEDSSRRYGYGYGGYG